MVFSSVTFLFYFLPLFFLFYYLLPCRNVTILTASLLFYAWGEARYVPLLIAYIPINWTFGLLIGGPDAGGVDCWPAESQSTSECCWATNT